MNSCTRHRTLSLAAVAAIVSTAWGFGRAQPAEVPKPPSKPMEAIDAIFTADYAIAQKAMVERVKETGLIVVDGPDLLLYLQGRLIDRATANAPPAYADLKTIDTSRWRSSCYSCPTRTRPRDPPPPGPVSGVTSVHWRMFLRRLPPNASPSLGAWRVSAPYRRRPCKCFAAHERPTGSTSET